MGGLGVRAERQEQQRDDERDGAERRHHAPSGLEVARLHPRQQPHGPLRPESESQQRRRDPRPAQGQITKDGAETGRTRRSPRTRVDRQRIRHVGAVCRRHPHGTGSTTAAGADAWSARAPGRSASTASPPTDSWPGAAGRGHEHQEQVERDQDQEVGHHGSTCRPEMSDRQPPAETLRVRRGVQRHARHAQLAQGAVVPAHLDPGRRARAPTSSTGEASAAGLVGGNGRTTMTTLARIAPMRICGAQCPHRPAPGPCVHDIACTCAMPSPPSDPTTRVDPGESTTGTRRAQCPNWGPFSRPCAMPRFRVQQGSSRPSLTGGATVVPRTICLRARPPCPLV